MNSNSEKQIIEDFNADTLNNKVKIDQQTGWKDITLSTNGYQELNRLKRALNEVCSYALQKVLFDGSEVEKESVMYSVVDMLNFSKKIDFEEESIFLDKVQELSKKKLIDEIKDSSKNLFWVSDEKAVDPSKIEKISSLDDYLLLNRKTEELA